MKPIVFAGIVVAVLGAIVLTNGIRYSSQRSVVKVGDFQASVQEQRTIPTWVGGAALIGGVLMVVAGLRGRKA